MAPRRDDSTAARLFHQAWSRVPTATRRRVVTRLGRDTHLVVQRPVRAELPDRPVVCVTHHKTGTVWLLGIFRELADRLELSFADGKTEGVAASGADIYAVTQPQGLSADHLPTDCRAVHVIRDPRDVIISGAKYHVRSTEPWLHVPRERFGGRSYSEAISALDTLEERLLFELENQGQNTIRAMMAWPRDDERFFEAKYEDLIDDVGMVHFAEIFGFLGFRGPALSVALSETWRKSLFGKANTSRSHVTSGAPRQFEQVFTPRLHDAFAERFPGVLDHLGYS